LLTKQQNKKYNNAEFSPQLHKKKYFISENKQFWLKRTILFIMSRLKNIVVGFFAK
jgi:hypothetical protein